MARARAAQAPKAQNSWPPRCISFSGECACTAAGRHQCQVFPPLVGQCRTNIAGTHPSMPLEFFTNSHPFSQLRTSTCSPASTARLKLASTLFSCLVRELVSLAKCESFQHHCDWVSYWWRRCRERRQRLQHTATQARCALLYKPHGYGCQAKQTMVRAHVAQPVATTPRDHSSLT